MRHGYRGTLSEWITKCMDLIGPILDEPRSSLKRSEDVLLVDDEHMRDMRLEAVNGAAID